MAQGNSIVDPASTRMARLVFPDQTNHHGTLFGGESLSLMATAASISAARHARQLVVLAQSEGIRFRSPVGQGSIVEIESRVVESGRTSMRVEAILDAEDLLTGERKRAAEGVFVFVAVNPVGKPLSFAISASARGGLEGIVTTERVLPGQVNHLGTLFGGELMRLLDMVAFIAGARAARVPLVTARSEQIVIERPVSLGDLVEIRAAVVESSDTAVLVEASVIGEQPLTGDRWNCTTGRFLLRHPRP